MQTQNNHKNCHLMTHMLELMGNTGTWLKTAMEQFGEAEGIYETRTAIFSEPVEYFDQ